MAVLIARHLRYDASAPDDPNNDHVVFSKGHASPLYYAMLKATGRIDDAELLTFRKFGSRLEGHPTPVLPWVDVATGSLGQGLPIAAGVALAGKRVLGAPFHVWAVVGDSETAEGSIWEALDLAGHEELTNLTAIVDVNRFGQSQTTMLEHDLQAYRKRFGAFGWRVLLADGHDIAEVVRVLRQTRTRRGRPVAVLAKTIKGKGYSKIEDQGGWHGKAVAAEAIDELGGVRNIVVDVPKPEPGESHRFQPAGAEWPRYEVGSAVSTRKAYGDALAALGELGELLRRDGEILARGLRHDASRCCGSRNSCSEREPRRPYHGPSLRETTGDCARFRHPEHRARPSYA